MERLWQEIAQLWQSPSTTIPAVRTFTCRTPASGSCEAAGEMVAAANMPNATRGHTVMTPCSNCKHMEAFDE